MTSGHKKKQQKAIRRHRAELTPIVARLVGKNFDSVYEAAFYLLECNNKGMQIDDIFGQMYVVNDRKVNRTS